MVGRLVHTCCHVILYVRGGSRVGLSFARKQLPGISTPGADAAIYPMTPGTIPAHRGSAGSITHHLCDILSCP